MGWVAIVYHTVFRGNDNSTLQAGGINLGPELSCKTARFMLFIQVWEMPRSRYSSPFALGLRTSRRRRHTSIFWDPLMSPLKGLFGVTPFLHSSLAYGYPKPRLIIGIIPHNANSTMDTSLIRRKSNGKP